MTFEGLLKIVAVIVALMLILSIGYSLFELFSMIIFGKLPVWYWNKLKQFMPWIQKLELALRRI